MLHALASCSALLAQSSPGFSSPSSGGGDAAAGGIVGLILLVIYLGVLVLVIAGVWKTFAKGGQPGWGAIIPIVNIYFVCKLVGRPGWWVILMFIPIVSFIIWIVLCSDQAKSFGRGIGTTLGLLFLPFIFYPVLGFGSAEYHGPAAAGGAGGLEDRAPMTAG